MASTEPFTQVLQLLLVECCLLSRDSVKQAQVLPHTYCSMLPVCLLTEDNSQLQLIVAGRGGKSVHGW